MQNYLLKITDFLLILSKYNTYPDVNRFMAFTKKDYIYYIDDIFKYEIIKNLDDKNIRNKIDQAYIKNSSNFIDLCLDFLEHVTSIQDSHTESRMLILTNEIVRGKSNFEVVRINGELVMMNSFQLHPNEPNQQQNEYEQQEEQEQLQEELNEELNYQNHDSMLATNQEFINEIDNYINNLENEINNNQEIDNLSDNLSDKLSDNLFSDIDEDEEESQEEFDENEGITRRI